MGSEGTAISERLQRTLDWQTRKLMARLSQSGAEARLRDYWRQTRRMAEVVERVALGPGSLSVDVGGGLTTPLRWLPGRRICVDPLTRHYSERFPLPHGRVTWLVGSGEALPIPSGVADLAICTNCIDHTEDPWAVAAEIHRVLRPGGWLWFTCEINPPDQERNVGHPHALDREALLGLVSAFDSVLSWEEPWRGIYRFLVGGEPFEAVELGMLLRKGAADDAG